MNRFVSRIGVGVTALLLVAGASFADGPKVVDNESFHVQLPDGFGDFAKATAPAPADNKGPVTTTYVAKNPNGDAVIVSVSEFSGKILDADKTMESSRDGLIKQVNATVESESKVPGDKPALNVTFKTATATPIFFNSRFVVDGARMYQVLYVARAEERRAGDPVKAMFDSFATVAATATAAAPAPAATPAPAAAPAPAPQQQASPGTN